MSELTPITRVESYLDAIVNNGIPPTEDITRIETFLQAIYDNVVCELTPIKRIEMFLGKISGQSLTLPEPITRVEMYLAAIAGEDVELPENPITRLEMYLADWADSGDWATISGAIVEFITQRAHKLKSCVVSLSPQQDLHGYDSPWPDGGGANKWDEEWIVAHQDIDTTTGEIVASGSNYQYFRSKNFIPVQGDTPFYNVNNAITGYYRFFYYDANKDYISHASKEVNSVITPPSNAAFMLFRFPVNSMGFAYQNNVAINYPATVTTYSPYSNICPISGWDGVTVYDNGINQWDEEWINGYIGVNGQYVYNANYIVSKNFIPVAPSTTYFLQTNGAQWEVYSYRADKTFIKRLVIYGADLTFTTEEDCRFIHIVSHAVTPTYGHDVSVNYPSTDTDYHAYTGRQISVTFGETVYGGRPDIISGRTPVTWEKIVLNGTEGWGTASAQGGGFYVQADSLKKLLNYNGSILCDKLKPYYNHSSLVSAPSGISGYYDGSDRYPTQNWIYVKVNGVSTVAELKTWLTENPLEVSYIVETPGEIQLTPTPITALKGYNAMWSDGGNIEVTVHGAPVEVSTQQALNMLLGGAYHNDGTAEDVSDDEALDIILGG